MKRRQVLPRMLIPRGNVPESPDGLRPLSPQQVEFVRQYVAAGANLKAAVALAKLNYRDSEGTARAWLWRPEVLFAIREEQKRAAVVAGSVALRTLVEIAQDKDQTGTARVAAAKTLAHMAILAAPAADPPKTEPGEGLGELAMTSDQRNVLTRIRRVIFEERENRSEES